MDTLFTIEEIASLSAHMQHIIGNKLAFAGNQHKESGLIIGEVWDTEKKTLICTFVGNKIFKREMYIIAHVNQDYGYSSALKLAIDFTTLENKEIEATPERRMKRSAIIEMRKFEYIKAQLDKGQKEKSIKEWSRGMKDEPKRQ